MSHAMPVLFRDLPTDELGTLYPAAKDKLPFESGSNLYTAHPKETALIRATAIAALAILSYYKPLIFVAGSSYIVLCSHVFPPTTDPWYPGAAALAIGTLARFAIDSSKLALAGSLVTLVYAAWIAYSHIYREDALVNAFYEIAGSKERFEALPELPTNDAAKSVSDWMFKTDWNKLDQAAYRAQTSDGRQILIVRTCQKDAGKNTFVPNTLGVEVYVEKYDETDNSSSADSLGRRVMDALINSQNSTFASHEKTFASKLLWKDKALITSEKLSINLKSHMTTERANELFAQLA